MKNSKIKILLVDDEPDILEIVGYNLKNEGYQIFTAKNGVEAVKSAKKNIPHLIILDIMMPEMDGWTVCKKIREVSDIPIIMLTALADVTDKVVGLELGADDYLPKPFEPRELVARIEAVLRRKLAPGDRDLSSRPRDLVIDERAMRVTLKAKEIELTTAEFELLLYFVRHLHQVVSRDDIMNTLQGIDSSVFSRSVDIMVSRLRQKLNDDSKNPRFIKTVRGKGYIFLEGELK